MLEERGSHKPYICRVVLGQNDLVVERDSLILRSSFPV